MQDSDEKPWTLTQSDLSFFIQFSQNHRIGLGTSGDQRLVQSSCSEEGQLVQVAQDHIQLGFKYLQGCRLTNCSQQPAAEFDHLHRKKVFPMSKWNFLYFNLCPLSLVLFLGATKKGLSVCVNMQWKAIKKTEPNPS